MGQIRFGCFHGREVFALPGVKQLVLRERLLFIFALNFVGKYHLNMGERWEFTIM
jgi:hypothetical protein